MRLLTAVSLVRVQQGELSEHEVRYVKVIPGSMVKRLRHRPFTAVTGVQIPLESSCERENEIFERHAESNVKREHADVAQFRLIDFVNKR